MLFFQLVLDNGSRKQSFEGVKQFESPVKRVVVVKPLRDYRRKPPFKLFNFGPEFIEVVIEIFFVNVHDIIFDLLEIFNRFLEFGRNL